jgi:hypothetical protein
MVYFSPSEGKERDVSWLSGSLVVDISDDGKILLFTENADRAGDQNRVAYIRNVDASDAVRLGDGWPSDLSADGKWVLAFMKGSMILLPAGAGQARALASGWEEIFGIFFPDGRKVLFSGSKPGVKEHIYVQDIEGGEPKVASPDGVYFTTFNSNLISPDAKWFVAYDDMNGYRLYPVEGGEPSEILGLQEGEEPLRWNKEGSALYVESGIPSRVYRLDPFSGRREFWKELMPPDPVGVHYVGPVFTPDGKTYAYAYNRTLSDLYVIEGLK